MGKRSSAPPPDPRLIEAHIRSLGIQDAMIQQIMENSNRLLPLQEEQMRFGLDTQRLAWNQAQEDRKFALEGRQQLRGLHNRLVADASSFNTDARREELAGQARADVAQAFGQARATNTRQMQRMGLNPNDGRSLAMGNQMAIAEASAAANAANKTRQAARLEGLAMTDRAVNALAGFPAMGMQATGAGAGYGVQGLNVANAALAGMNSGFGQAGGLAGQMGSSATSMWGAQANYHTNNQSQDTIGGILGGLGGAAMGFGNLFGKGAGGAAATTAATAILSDRRLKTAIRPEGKHEPTGLTLYRFCYRGDPQMKEYVGVMADEVAQRYPEAVHTDASGFMAVDYGVLGIPFKEV